MVTETAMLAAVAAIYDAGVDPSLWPTAMEHMAEMLHATAGVVGLVDASSEITFRSPVRADPKVMSEYLDFHRKADPTTSGLWARPPRQAFSDEMIGPKRELWKSELYNEWIKPNDLEHSIQGFAFRDGGRNGFLALARAPHLSAFTQAEVDVVTALLPHIARALHVQIRLQMAEISRDGMADALDRMPQAVLLVDAQARVLHLNQAAETLFSPVGQSGEGSRGLVPGRPDQSRALRALVTRASLSGPDRVGGSMLLDLPRVRGRLVAHVVPCRAATDIAWGFTFHPTAIVIVAEPRRTVTGEAQRTLRTLFGLTAAEAKAACLVAGGSGVAAAAAALGVEPSTVRTHLVRAYAKTGVPGQAKLSALLDQVTAAAPPATLKP